MTASLFFLAHDDVEQTTLQQLSAAGIFAGLNTKSLLAFVEAGEIRSYVALEEALVEGEIPRAINIVLSGRFVALLPGEHLARYGNSTMVRLDCFVAGDSFGEQALTTEGIASVASVVATEPARVLAIDQASFQRVVSSDICAAQVVYRNLFELQTRRLATIAA